MAKTISDTVLDQSLNYIKNNAGTMSVCEGHPANYSDATTNKGSGGDKLADVSVSSTDFTLAAGDTSGRKVTQASKSGVNVDVDGIANHIAWLDDGSSAILAVTQLPSYAITAKNTTTEEITLDSAAGDVTSDFPASRNVTIEDSSDDNGNYTVSSSTFDGTNTIVTVNEDLTGGTGDGTLISAQKLTGGNTTDIPSTDYEIQDPQA